MERVLSAAMQAGISAGNVRPAFFVEGEYGDTPNYLRLWTGVGNKRWDGKTWVGGGRLLNISTIEESTDLKAVGFSVTLSGMPSDQVQVAQSSMRQGSRGRLWLALIGEEVIESGTAQAGSATSLTLKADAAPAANAHGNKLLRLTGGAGATQERPIFVYDGDTKVATVESAWTSTPDSTTTYDVINEAGIVADPVELKRGKFDVVVLKNSGRECTIQAVYEDRLVDLEKPRIRRWTPEDQKRDYPDDEGFSEVAALVDAEFQWG